LARDPCDLHAFPTRRSSDLRCCQYCGSSRFALQKVEFMTEPTIAGIQFTQPDATKPVLVLGPGLGTAVEPLWGKAAKLLADDYAIIGYDLPGNGRSEASTDQWEIDDLANIAARLATEATNGTDRKAYFAGVSLSGAVAQRIAALHGDVFDRV